MSNDLTKQSPSDHAVNIIKAAASSFPFGGGLVASLISDYIPKSREKKTVEFVNKLSEDFERYQDLIDQEYVKSGEFEFLLLKSWRAAIEHYQKDKINGFRAILVNSAIGKKATAEEKELFVSVLENLTGYHLELLKLLQDPIEWNKANGERVKPSERPESTSCILQNCLPNWDMEHISIIVNDLNIRGLIDIQADHLNTLPSRDPRMSIFEPPRGIRRLIDRLTPFGAKFLDFVTQKQEVA